MSTEKYDVIIIGAGIGGLVCGCYLAKAGLKVLIVEQQDKPGGYCTSFTRDGYTFDVGVHYLGGVKNGVLSKILSELDLENEVKFMKMDPVEKIVFSNIEFFIRDNFQKTLEECQKIFRKEKINIKNFFVFLKEKDFYYIAQKLRNKNFYFVLRQFFCDKKLINIFGNIMLLNYGLNHHEISAITAFTFLRQYFLDPGYYPIGSMQNFPNVLCRYFTLNGGKIIFSKEVKEILIFNNCVRGVILNDNEKIFSNYVVSNADAYHTFNYLLKNRYNELKKIKKLKISCSPFAIYIGLNYGFHSSFHLKCDEYICFRDSMRINTKREIFDSEEVNWLVFYSSKDESNHKKTLQIFTGVDYVSRIFWEKNKELFANKLFNSFKKRFPGIHKFIKLKIIATPNTFYKYTNNKNGAAFGWASTKEQVKNSILQPETSIRGFLMAGHWTSIGTGYGGVAMAALSGRIASKIIIEKANKEWNYQRILP